jgi:oligo-1,6-glucosidase
VPWLKVNPDAAFVNVAAQEKDDNSVLNYFRCMVRLRKQNPVLIYGHYEVIDKDNEQVYAYTRELNNEKWIVVLNFTKQVVQFSVPEEFQLSDKDFLINNYKQVKIMEQNIILQPYQAIITKRNSSKIH